MTTYSQSTNSEAKRVLLITGASRGIGAATAKLAGSIGYRVCVNYAQNTLAAQSVVAEITSSGGEAIALRADTSSENDVATMFAHIAERLGPVTDLVNNAGIVGGPARFEDLEIDELRRLLDVNVLGYMLCCREAIRQMSVRNGGQGGRIVNVSSVAAINGSSGERVHYAASKGAINSFTTGLAKEVARDGIRVNAFSPGITVTDMNPIDRLERLAPQVPIGRAAQAEEMARGILWLLSDDASYCLAANLVMSGGR